jgi:hypothetical protein
MIFCSLCKKKRHDTTQQRQMIAQLFQSHVELKQCSRERQSLSRFFANFPSRTPGKNFAKTATQGYMLD